MIHFSSLRLISQNMNSFELLSSLFKERDIVDGDYKVGVASPRTYN